MKRILLPLMMLLTSMAVAKDSSVPVMIGVFGDGDLDACMSTGSVSGLNPKGEGFLAVRSGPAGHYTLLDKLKEGQQVFLCSTSKDEQWHGIVYASGKNEDCGVSSPVKSPRAYVGRCKSGWVSAKWIKLAAG